MYIYIYIPYPPQLQVGVRVDLYDSNTYNATYFDIVHLTNTTCVKQAIVRALLQQPAQLQARQQLLSSPVSCCMVYYIILWYITVYYSILVTS